MANGKTTAPPPVTTGRDVASGDEPEIRDGRRRKGQRRRRLLVEAVMRVIERDGVAAVSQRVVAEEAGLPPSAVTYYFPTVDELLTAALTACNDHYIRRLDELATDPRPLERLAELVVESTDPSRRAYAAAEYELYLMAARRPDMRAEVDRWIIALDTYLAPLVPDPARRAGVSAAVDGLLLRCMCGVGPSSAAEALRVLERLAA